MLMLAEYSFELGLAKRVSPLSLVTNPSTLFFTAMEVLPALAWLYFVRIEQVVLGCILIEARVRKYVPELLSKFAERVVS